MIIDLIDKLISRVLDLLREEQRTKKSVYDNFAKPLIEQFEELHNDYVSTFLKYREAIIQEGTRLHNTHPVFDLIKNDSLSTDSMRVKLGALWRVINEEKGRSSDFKGLLRAIALYLEFSVTSHVPTNSPRGSIVTDLMGASKEDAISMIEDKINELQVNYADVLEGYEHLKMKLLK